MPAEFHDRGHAVAAAVVVLIDNLINGAALRPFADRVNTRAERQHALDVLDLVADTASTVSNVPSRLVSRIKSMPPALARSQDVARRVERHRDQRAGLLVGDEPLDGEFGIDQKPRAFVGDHHFIAPRQRGAQRAIDLGRQPDACRGRSALSNWRIALTLVRQVASVE